MISMEVLASAPGFFGLRVSMAGRFGGDGNAINSPNSLKTVDSASLDGVGSLFTPAAIRSASSSGKYRRILAEVSAPKTDKRIVAFSLPLSGVFTHLTFFGKPALQELSHTLWIAISDVFYPFHCPNSFLFSFWSPHFFFRNFLFLFFRPSHKKSS